MICVSSPLHFLSAGAYLQAATPGAVVGGRGGKMSAPAEELKRIILQHVAQEHRDHALMLLKTIEQRRYLSEFNPLATLVCNVLSFKYAEFSTLSSIFRLSCLPS